MRRLMAEQKLEASSARPTSPGRKRGPTNSELRLRRLAAEKLDFEPRGILEIFAEGEQADEDAPLARDDHEHEQ
jgi:hypothetical protein